MNNEKIAPLTSNKRVSRAVERGNVSPSLSRGLHLSNESGLFKRKVPDGLHHQEYMTACVDWVKLSRASGKAVKLKGPNAQRSCPSKLRATSKRGQLFSIDAVVAIGIFILIMVSCIWIWDYSREKVYLNVRRETLEISARNALSSLCETPGNPSNWHEDQGSFNESSINSLGLAGSRPWVLSEEKIQAMQDWYPAKNETYKTLLGLKGYGFHLEFWKFDSGFGSDPDYEVGGNTAGTYNVVRLQRAALLSQGGSKYWLRVIMEVWEPG